MKVSKEAIVVVSHLLPMLQRAVAGAAGVNLEAKTSKTARRAKKSKSLKEPKSTKNGKAEQVCKERCNLHSSALRRCPRSPSNEETAEADSCVEGCVKASFDKRGSDQDFNLKNVVQCRVNHAKMAIKEGHLTSSKHRLHATFEGPERRAADEASLKSAPQSTAGKCHFCNVSAVLKEAGTDKMAQTCLTLICCLIELRGRLFVACPNFENEPQNMKPKSLKSTNTKKADCETPARKQFKTADGTCNGLEMR
jgi:hypothetical protein